VGQLPNLALRTRRATRPIWENRQEVRQESYSPQIMLKIEFAHIETVLHTISHVCDKSTGLTSTWRTLLLFQYIHEAWYLLKLA